MGATLRVLLLAALLAASLQACQAHRRLLDDDAEASAASPTAALAAAPEPAAAFEDAAPAPAPSDAIPDDLADLMPSGDDEEGDGAAAAEPAAGGEDEAAESEPLLEEQPPAEEEAESEPEEEAEEEAEEEEEPPKTQPPKPTQNPNRYDPATSYSADVDLSLRGSSKATVGTAPTATGACATSQGWLRDVRPLAGMRRWPEGWLCPTRSALSSLPCPGA